MGYITRKVMPLFLLTILLFSIIFVAVRHTKVSAGTVNLGDVTRVESILIKKGDSLTSIASQYASEKSHITQREYMEQIISLNDLKSEHIEAGQYLLIPDYKA